jgi:hypothetical protein
VRLSETLVKLPFNSIDPGERRAPIRSSFRPSPVGLVEMNGLGNLADYFAEILPHLAGRNQTARLREWPALLRLLFGPSLSASADCEEADRRSEQAGASADVPPPPFSCSELRGSGLTWGVFAPGGAAWAPQL